MAFPTTIAPIQPPPDDPFLYGWRYVRHTDPYGGDQFDQIPLTLEDVLHPEEGDFIVHSEAHERRNLYLYDVFGARLEPVMHFTAVAGKITGWMRQRLTANPIRPMWATRNGRSSRRT